MFFYYLNPLARQHVDAADCQLLCSVFGLRKSRHGCHPLQRLLLPTPEHFAYLRNEQVWFDTLPESVVHLTTMF